MQIDVQFVFLVYTRVSVCLLCYSVIFVRVTSRPVSFVLCSVFSNGGPDILLTTDSVNSVLLCIYSVLVYTPSTGI